MFEADFWDVDSLSRTNFFPIRPLRKYRSPAGWLSSASTVIKGHLCASKAQQSFFLKHPVSYTFVMMGGEKLIGKALWLVGFLSYLDSGAYQTQAVLLRKNWTSIHLPSWWATSRSQTD